MYPEMLAQSMKLFGGTDGQKRANLDPFSYPLAFPLVYIVVYFFALD